MHWASRNHLSNTNSDLLQVVWTWIGKERFVSLAQLWYHKRSHNNRIFYVQAFTIRVDLPPPPPRLLSVGCDMSSKWKKDLRLSTSPSLPSVLWWRTFQFGNKHVFFLRVFPNLRCASITWTRLVSHPLGFARPFSEDRILAAHLKHSKFSSSLHGSTNLSLQWRVLHSRNPMFLGAGKFNPTTIL